MKSLVVYTCFVGSNSYKFNKFFNSKNIETAYDTSPDLLVYSDVPTQKFLANKNIKEDIKIILANLKQKMKKKLKMVAL